MSILNNIKIYDTEYTKIRIGREKDGGYIVLEENLKNADLLYSYGISDDVSFELDFLDKNPNCFVKLFDHTIDFLPENHKNFCFIKEGLSSRKQINTNTLKNHLKKYSNNLEKSNKILKIDIEWNEWDVFEKMQNNVLDQFDQILCEFHFIPVQYKDSHTEYFTNFHKFVYNKINENLFLKYQRVLNKIFDKYYIFHLHVNNSLPLNNILNDEFPALLEMSLVNKKIVKKPKLINVDFPIQDLDFPNKPYKEDVLNFNWKKYS